MKNPGWIDVFTQQMISETSSIVMAQAAEYTECISAER